MQTCSMKLSKHYCEQITAFYTALHICNEYDRKLVCGHKQVASDRELSETDML